MTDLGTDILGNAEPMMLVCDFVLHLKIEILLFCKWNEHKNNHKGHRQSYCVGPVLKHFGEKAARQVTHHYQPAFIVRIILPISRRTKQNKHFCPRVEVSLKSLPRLVRATTSGGR